MPFTQKTHSTDMKPHSLLETIIYLTVCLVVVLTSIPVFAAPLPSSEDTASDKAAPNPPALTITQPAFGTSLTGSDVSVSILLSRQEDTSTLRVKLNGHDISGRFHSGSCTTDACTMLGDVSQQDGLKKGENLIFAQSSDLEKKAGASRRVTFNYQISPKNSTGNTIQYYEPASVGISTVPNGGNGGTWINITTGNAAGVTDSALNSIPGNNTITVPYPDSSIQINCPGWQFQAVILDRTNPSAPPETATCANSEADMESYAATNLGRPLDSRDLIIFGTTPYHFADAANVRLDTSSIGGTNWGALEKASPFTVWYYDIIGVKGATPGTAHESYTTAPGPDTPFQYASNLAGTLMLDGDGNYNYIPSAEQEFQLVSGQNPTLKVGWQSYTMPSTNAAGAFWVMVLDRFLLQPINYSAGSWTNCGYAQANQACGGVFDVHKDGGAALASILAGVNPQNLVILATQGCPFDNAGEISSALGTAVQNLGGMQYSLQALNTTAGTCAYALVTNHIRPTSSAPVSQSPLSGSVAFSASQFSAQDQTGAIHGYLARDNQGLYKVAMADQMLTNKNSASLSKAIDYTFEQTASSQRQDWPLTDTPGHLAAYHDISQQLLSTRTIGETGSHIYDVRYFYTNLAIAHQLAGLAGTTFTRSAWDTASATEFQDAQNEIANELQQLGSAMGYLTGDDGSGGIEGMLNGSKSSILPSAFAIANDIGQDQDKAAQQLVNANSSNIMNLFAGIVSTASAIVGPIDEEYVSKSVGAFLGVTSGALWTGSAGVTPLTGALPGPESQYDVMLASIINNGATYSNNVAEGYGAAVDNIFTDGAKLATIGALTSNSDSGWNIQNLAQVSGLSSAIISGEARSLWLDVMKGVYGIRQANSQPYSDPSAIGSWLQNGYMTVCSSVYSSVGSGVVPASSTVSYPTLGSPQKFDVYIFAEGPTVEHPKYQQSIHDYGVSSNISDLLTTATDVDGQGGLNIPPMMLYTSSQLTFGPPAYYNPDERCEAVPISASPSNFSIQGPSSGLVGQRAGTYTITPVDGTGNSDPSFKGAATVTLTGPGNMHLHRQVTFRRDPVIVSFTAAYREPGTYKLEVSAGSLTASKQITVVASTVPSGPPRVRQARDTESH